MTAPTTGTPLPLVPEQRRERIAEFLRRHLEAVAPVAYARTGGTIPVAIELQRVLGAVPVLLDMGLDDDRLHAPDERFELHHDLQGIRASAAALQALRSLSSSR